MGGESTARVSQQLGQGEIRAWWQEASPAIARLTEWMDGREPWVVEPDDDFIDLLGQVVAQVEQPEFVAALESELAAELVQVFGFLCSSRFLRMLGMFERRSPGIACRFVFIVGRLGGEMQVFSDLFCERLLLVHRVELLGEIVSPQRCQSIVSAIRLLKESQV